MSCAPEGLDSLPANISLREPVANPVVTVAPFVPHTGNGNGPGGHGRVWVRNKKTRRTRHWVEPSRPLHELRHSRAAPQVNQAEFEDDNSAHDDGDDQSMDTPYRPLDVQHSILQHLNSPSRAALGSPHDLAGVIAEICVNVFDQHGIPSDYRFLDFFVRSIGGVVSFLKKQRVPVMGNMPWSADARIVKRSCAASPEFQIARHRT